MHHKKNPKTKQNGEVLTTVSEVLMASDNGIQQTKNQSHIWGFTDE